MFGYVHANSNELTLQERRRYQAFYCGLCVRLGQMHKQRSRLLLSYDMTFLAILLTGLYECESVETENNHCLLHPIKKHDEVLNEFVDYAADMTVALSYYNFLDDWQDSHKYSSYLLAQTVRKEQLVVSQKYPIQCAAIHQCLAQLARYEDEKNYDLDAVSGCFGELLAAMFEYRHDVWSPTMHALGYSLGKFIYLMDAYEDLPVDKKTGNYNPLTRLTEQDDYQQHIHEILTMLMANCADCFERLPILQDAGILRNILYSGVWSRYTMLQANQNDGGSKPE